MNKCYCTRLTGTENAWFQAVHIARVQVTIHKILFLDGENSMSREDSNGAIEILDGKRWDHRAWKVGQTDVTLLGKKVFTTKTSDTIYISYCLCYISYSSAGSRWDSERNIIISISENLHFYSIRLYLFSKQLGEALPVGGPNSACKNFRHFHGSESYNWWGASNASFKKRQTIRKKPEDEKLRVMRWN